MQILQLGVRPNLTQVVQQLLQVLLVGMTVGMMRNVVPALAESEFGVPRGSFLLLVTFVVGVVRPNPRNFPLAFNSQHSQAKFTVRAEAHELQHGVIRLAIN
jgi:hypothetical protein